MSKHLRISDDAHRMAKIAAAREGVAMELWASRALIEAAQMREAAAKIERGPQEKSA